MTLETVPDVQVSVLIPVKDEEATLATLVTEIGETFATLPEIEYEVIFVDDGSVDRSWQVMQELAAGNERIRALRLRRNFGKAAALAAAVDEARGERVVTMDADLQDDPAEVPRLLAELDDGADLVSGHKADRKDPLGKRLPSKFFNMMTGVITGLKLNDHNCGLKAARTEVYRRVPLYGELHRYIPALAHQTGYKVRELAVQPPGARARQVEVRPRALRARRDRPADGHDDHQVRPPAGAPVRRPRARLGADRVRRAGLPDRS